MEKKKERLQSLLDRSKLEKYCYEMFYLQGVPVAEVARKTGLNRQTIYRYLRNFEAINPQVAEQMKKNGKDVTPDDYKALQEEVARLQGELKREKLRAGFSRSDMEPTGPAKVFPSISYTGTTGGILRAFSMGAQSTCEE